MVVFFTGCQTQADVTFILDSSDQVGRDNFFKQKQFVKKVVSHLNVESNQVRVGAVKFSTRVENQFFLNQYRNKTDVQNAIDAIIYSGGHSNTANAIKYVRMTSFGSLHGARNNIPHIAVLVTNGPSTTKALTEQEAQTAKDSNVMVYTVGVGGGVNLDELRSVSSNPNSRYVLKAESYSAVDSIAGVLATRLCNGKFTVFIIILLLHAVILFYKVWVKVWGFSLLS